MKERMQHASAKGDVGKDHLPKEEIAERAGMYGLRCSIGNLRQTGKKNTAKKRGSKER